MDERIRQALENDLTIDITTTGRKSGQPRRIEIWYKRVAGRTFITGTPGKRSWYANMVAEPRIVFHLKETLSADLSATVRPIVEQSERLPILSDPVMSWYHTNSDSRDDFINNAPLVEIIFDDE